MRPNEEVSVAYGRACWENELLFSWTLSKLLIVLGAACAAVWGLLSLPKPFNYLLGRLLAEDIGSVLGARIIKQTDLVPNVSVCSPCLLDLRVKSFWCLL